MSSADPVLVYLEVPHAAGPRAILGLGDGPVDEDTIKAAMTMRRKMVDRHPLCEEPAADKVREIILAAGAALLATPAAATVAPDKPIPPRRIRPRNTPAPVAKPVPPRPSITEAHLTPFDRLVLAVLLAGGGWNSRTRSILTGLASQVGLDPVNLRRVVLGLGKFVQEHGSKGTVDSAAELPLAPPPPRPVGRIEGTMTRLSDGLAREVRGENTGSLLRMLAVFILIAGALGFLLVWVLDSPSRDARSLEARREAAVAKVTQDMQDEQGIESGSEVSEHTIVPSTRSGVVLPAK